MAMITSPHRRHGTLWRHLSLLMLIFFVSVPTWAGITARVSVASDGTQGSGASRWPSISADGRYVAFTSTAANLVENDTNGKQDIFVHDRQTGTTVLVSRGHDGSPANGASDKPSISADGRYVAFESDASNLVPGDTGGYKDVFRCEWSSGTTICCSISSTGEFGSSTSYVPAISGNGQHVFFSSGARNLGFTINDWAVFGHDCGSRTTTLVSVNTAGGAPNSGCGYYYKSISSDFSGTKVAFVADASNLVANDTNGKADVFLRDLAGGTTRLVSMTSAGVQGDNGSYSPVVSADGNFVAFQSLASNLAANDTNSKYDIYLRDMSSGNITLVSATPTGASGDNYSQYMGGVSSDGRYVLFSSSASDLVAGDTNGVADIFLRDTQEGTTVRVNVSSSGGQGNSSSNWCHLASDMLIAAFESNANNLVPGDTNGSSDVFTNDVNASSNIPPVAENVAATTHMNTPVSGTLSASDADGDPLTFHAQTSCPLGTLVLDDPATGAFTFTPTPNMAGTAVLNFSASDGQAESNVATLTVTITNTPPLAQNVAVSTHMNTPVSGTLSATDADGDALTFHAQTSCDLGTLVLDDPATGAFTFTPNPNVVGDAVLNFSATDGQVESNPATLTVTITNTAPVASTVEVETPEETSVSGTLVATDPDGDPLTFSAQTSCELGTLVLDDPATGAFTFTPVANQTGVAVLNFSASDGQAESNVATLTVTITAVQEPPTAANQTVATDEDTSVAVLLQADDADGDPLTWVVSAPQHGELTGEAPNLTYTPHSDWFGADFFTFYVNDGLADSNTATVTIDVAPLNDAPVADSKTVSTIEDLPVSGMLTGSDVDGDAITFALASNGTLGTVMLDDATTGAFTYTPNAGVYGTDTFTVTASDGTLTSDPATITVIIEPINDPPTAGDGKITTAEDMPCEGMLIGNDPDGDVLTFTIANAPQHGTVQITDAAQGLFVYTPAQDYFGMDEFTFTVSDGLETSAPATMQVIVKSVNDQPTVSDLAITTPEDTSVDGQLPGSDPDGTNGVRFRILVNGLKGRINLTDAATGAFTYVPYANVFGTDTITFDLYDGKLASTPGTLTVTITEVNDLPVAVDDSFDYDPKCRYAGYLPVARNDYDTDGDVFTITSVTQPEHGAVTIDNAYTVHYTPAAGYNGEDTFTYTIDDGRGGTGTGTVVVRVRQVVNQSPKAMPDKAEATTGVETAINVLANDADPNGDPLVIVAVTAPEHGTVVIDGENGRVLYTSHAGYIGQDVFTYTVSDDKGATATANVMVTVDAPNNPPVAVDDAGETYDVQPITLYLLKNDTDVDGDKLYIKHVSTPPSGSLSIYGDRIIYYPKVNSASIVSFSYLVSDEHGATDTGTISVTVRMSLKNVKLSAQLQSYDPKNQRWTVSCKAQSSGGTDNIRYVFYYRPSNSKTWRTFASGSRRDVTATITTAGTYYFRVVATDSYTGKTVSVADEAGPVYCK